MKRAAARPSFSLVALVGLLSQQCVHQIRPSPSEIYHAPLLTGDPPATPLARLETGMHTNQITQIATDRGGRWLVTASYDKTARVWELATGTLLQVLRPPQADGNEGMLFAVALSPEGDKVAVAGATGFFDREGGSIYIFDRVTGRLLRRIPGLSLSVTRLAFSPDGNSLAAAAGSYLRLLDPITGNEVAREACDVYTYGLDFRHDGKRLVTASLNGKLRVYAVEPTSVRIIVEARAPVSEQPFAARFSPDGSRIAVGFHDSTDVAVLDASTLALAFTPDTSGVHRDNLMAVSWSADGSFLYAAGRWFASGKYSLRRWSAAGRGAHVDIPLANSTIEDLIPLPEGKLAFAAADPLWGVLSVQNQVLFRRDGAAANFIRLGDGLRVSNDGAQVRFGYEYLGEAPAVFDVAAESLGADRDGLAAPRISAPNLTIEDWKESYFPVLNGKALPLQEHEMSRCLAIGPDENRFALGTDWHLRLFDRGGNLLWRMPAPATTFAVNISADGRWVVAAYGDGTIRWHRIEDGKEVLAFFPHADRKRWIAWTPEGFFNASPGAEALIGYHLNKGWEKEGEFVSASQLMERYYRPTLIPRRLSADGERLVEQVVARLGDVRKVLVSGTTPELELLSDPYVETAGECKLEVRIKNAEVGKPRLTLKVDGVEIKGRPVDVPIGASGRVSLTVPLPEGNHSLDVIAVDGRGVESQPVKLQVRVRPTQARPALHVLAVGVSKYVDSDLNLKFAADDAREISKRFKERAAGLFQRGVNVKSILDSDATASNIENELDRMLQSVDRDDTFVLYLAGHGTVLDETYYFLPYETQYENDAAIRNKGVSEEKLREWLGKLPLKSLFLLDTCRAGEVIKVASRAVEDNGAISRIMRRSQRAIIAAATGTQIALEGHEGHGVFTYVLLDAMSHADYNRDGKVDTIEFAMHARTIVPKITERKWHIQQVPMQDIPGDPFPLTVAEAKGP
jgi:WD40 repeat protein